MAISLKAAGAWARVVTDPSSVTIPGVPLAGDRMFLFANWKTFDVTVANPSGWTPIVNSFADGTTAAGNGSGSVSVAAWYRDWQVADGNPSLNWSASPTEAHAVVMLWTKGVGDTWGTPSFATGAIAAADPFTVNASTTKTVANASVVMGMVALRDDSTAMTRATDAIDDTGGLVTWNGNYVESPATHFNSTTGLDMSGDLGHRFVTTGAAGVTLHMDGDITAAESGSALFVLQALFVSNPQSVTPSTASLTISAFAPTVTATANQSVTPTAASLTTALFAPTISLTDNQRATPPTVSLATTAFEPSISTTDHQTVTPGVASLATEVFAPTASTPTTVTPDTVSVALTTFEPTVTVEEHDVTATPDVAALTTGTFAPTVSTPWLATPATLVVATVTFAPTVTAPRLVTPSTKALTSTGLAPVVSITTLVVPDLTSLTLTTHAPSVTATANWRVTPATRTFLLARFAPTVTASGQIEPVPAYNADTRLPFPQQATPAPGRLQTTMHAPTIKIGDDAEFLRLVAQL